MATTHSPGITSEGKRPHGHVALSLFSGCGGCSLGLKDAGFEIALGAEWNDDACATYRANVSGRVLKADLASASTQNLLTAADVTPSDIHLLVAGPPCQSFTSAGVRDWDDPRNLLLHRTMDFISELRPPWIVVENVEGLLTAQGGFFFVQSVLRLLELGYWVTARKVYMHTYGIPQRRKRVILVGNRVGMAYVFPEPTHAEEAGGNLFDAPPPVSILDAIGDLGQPTSDGVAQYARAPQNRLQACLRGHAQQTTWHRAKCANETTRARIEALASGQTMKDLPAELQHPSYRRRALRRVMDGTPTEKRGGAPAGLKKLIAADPCLTVTSASPAEFVHPHASRLLSLRECARVQTFPDTFDFIGSWSSVATQVGNAIPPLFMKLLAADIAAKGAWDGRNTRGRWLGISASKSLGHSPALAAMLAVLEQSTSRYA